MYCFTLLFVLFLLITLSYSDDIINDNLIETYGKVIFCSALFRHGDRTANNPYPTDPYQIPFWIEGKAQLTKVGKLHEYELGQFFKNRYDYLLKSRPYRYDFLQMRSSDVDRTLMSAELFLAGFYPPSPKEIWNEKEKLQWQPIPVHTLPKNMDNIIAQEMPCEKYDLELSILNNSPEFQALFEEHQKIFDYVSIHSGLQLSKNNVFNAFSDLWDVYDDLSIEEQNNLTLPTWTKKIYPRPLKELAEFYFSIPSYTKEMQRLKGGPILQLIITDMIEKLAKPSNFTFHFYSGHDTTVAVLLDTLGVFNRLAPPYSSSVIVELREKNGLHYVTVLYKNSTENPYLLEIPYCKNPCFLEDFIIATQSVVPDDYASECDLNFFTRLYYFPSFNLIRLGLGFLAVGSFTNFSNEKEVLITLVLSLIGIILFIRKLLVISKNRYKNYETIREDGFNNVTG